MTDANIVLTGDEQPLKSALQRGRDDLNKFGNEALQPFGKLRDAIGNIGNLMMGFGAIRLTQLADEAALIQARIKDVAGGLVEAQQAQTQLYAASQKLQVSYADLSGSFSKMLPAVKQMGGGTNEAIRLAEILSTTARLSGASSEEASASAQQFAQALQSGVLQGDELKSILENNGNLARSLADGLGVTVGELRKLGADGKLTADKVAGALLGQYDKIQSRSAELPQTVGGAWTQITNAFQQFVATANEGTGVFGGLSAVMSALAQVIDSVRVVMGSTDEQADKIGKNESIKQWGQTVGAAFAYVIDLGRAVWEVLQVVQRGVGALGAAAAAAMRGEVSQAGQIMKDAVADAEGSWERIKALTTGGTGSTLQTYALNSGQSAPDTTPGSKLKSTASGKDKKSKADKSQMGDWEATLAEEKAFLAQHGDLLDQARNYELAYWQSILDTAKVKEEDKVAIRKKMAQIRAEAAKDEAKTESALDQEALETWKQVQELKLEQERILAKTQKDAGQITKAELIDQEIQFEERRYQIAVEYLNKRAALTPGDKVARAKADGDIEVEGLRRDNKVADLTGQKSNLGVADQFDAMWKGMAGSATNGFGQILKGAQTWQSAMMSVFKGVRDAFMKSVVLEPMNAQIAAWGKQLAMKLGFMAKEEAAQDLSTGKVIGTKLTETSTVAGANAVQAGTGAAASQAAIPVVGPALALGAMAAIFAAVSAMGGKMKSARNGYDIPAGVNPVTQLHEEEMVLPKEQANAIREMAANGGGGGATFAPNITVKAMDARGVAQALRRGGALESALRGLHRDFVKV